MTRYRTIVADPPRDIGKRGSYSWRDGRPSGSVRPLDYPTMTLDAIAAIPVATLADDSAHLFMWTTQRHLGPAFDIVKAWGFRYVCALAWRWGRERVAGTDVISDIMRAVTTGHARVNRLLIVLRRREEQEGRVRVQYRRGYVYEGRSWLLGPWLVFIGKRVQELISEKAGRL